MAKPTSLPDAALDHAAEQALARLAELPPVTPPAPPELPDHPAFPETSVALPEQAHVPDAVQLPEWLVA
jgi:hypothetical protein